MEMAQRFRWRTVILATIYSALLVGVLWQFSSQHETLGKHPLAWQERWAAITVPANSTLGILSTLGKQWTRQCTTYLDMKRVAQTADSLLSESAESVVVVRTTTRASFHSKDLSDFVSHVIGGNEGVHDGTEGARGLRAGGGLDRHVRLLVHVPDATAPLANLAAADRAAVLATSTIPALFWPRCVLYSDADLVLVYGTKVYKNWFESGHVGLVWFMMRNPNYRFLWLVEDDVRLIGSWQRLFDSVSHQAKVAFPGSATLPDLVTFDSYIQPHSDWSNNENERSVSIKKPITKNKKICDRGWSRNLATAMHHRFLNGENCYYEEFVPSVVHNNLSLTVLSVVHPQYIPITSVIEGKTEYDASTYVYTGDVSSNLYHDFMQSGDCFPDALIHPIKIK
ncbi:hypothetical protein HK100_006221 [Physocladia obscura]|uniref:Uncharacterized protein n=1 Tax=Physocladia obscura TaxID=109957 RepID=A0AAD5X8W9_9FUNG|nr:hypothetical protein HK100_006221 [Physocladia obscura]